jgi:hypothetical protein
MTIVYRCDRCGMTSTSFFYHIKIMNPFHEKEGVSNQELDLCRKCKEEFMLKFLKSLYYDNNKK